jgi:hypothetical protein
MIVIARNLYLSLRQLSMDANVDDLAPRTIPLQLSHKWHEFEVVPNVNLKLPGIYVWEIEGAGTHLSILLQEALSFYC